MMAKLVPKKLSGKRLAFPGPADGARQVSLFSILVHSRAVRAPTITRVVSNATHVSCRGAVPVHWAVSPLGHESGPYRRLDTCPDGSSVWVGPNTGRCIRIGSRLLGSVASRRGCPRRASHHGQFSRMRCRRDTSADGRAAAQIRIPRCSHRSDPHCLPRPFRDRMQKLERVVESESGAAVDSVR